MYCLFIFSPGGMTGSPNKIFGSDIIQLPVAPSLFEDLTELFVTGPVFFLFIFGNVAGKEENFHISILASLFNLQDDL